MKKRSPHRRSPKKRGFLPGGDCRGYLLPEIMIAIGIFSIGFLAVGSLVISGTTNNATGNKLTQATFLGSETLESLKSQPITSLVDGTTGTDPHPVDARGNPGGIYTRRWTIANLTGSTTAREIVVTVSWPRLGQTREVTLRTITKGNGT
jgi:Tfp pilus assembly protein PilV